MVLIEKFWSLKAVAFLCLASGSAFVSATSGPSDTPIATTAPNLTGGKIANTAPPGPFFQGFKPPYPTDAWWSGYSVGTQDATVSGPFPFESATTNTSIVFGISNKRDFDGTSIHQPTQNDWSVGIAGLPNDLQHRKATSWDTQTVCLQYFTDSGSTMSSCMAPGSPYMTFTFKNAVVNINSMNGNLGTITWVTAGKKAKITNSAGTYLLYAVDTALTLTTNANTLVSQSGYTGTIRMALLNETSQEAILDQYVGAYPTGLTMSYAVSGNTSTQTWKWSTAGTSSTLLTLSWPHHRKVLSNPSYANIQYLTTKGYMKGVVGNTWTLTHSLPSIYWFAPNAPQSSCLSQLNQTLQYDVSALSVIVPGDFYYWGGSFARAARLALIAEQTGRTDLVNKVVTILKQSFAYWLDATHSPAAAYETGWGGVINKDGWNNTWVDFGNAYYNDHHFHYGYFLYGAAVIGKYDATWLAQNKDFLTHVARDIGNPSPNDPYYTVTRHMDWFAGHSWASGIANGAGSRDQESTGEAINGYYGLLMFAKVTGNNALIDYARMLLAVEEAGAQTYWHLYPSVTADTPYPEAGFRNLITVGNVEDWQTGAWLFWGAQRTEIAAIQMLPLTPIGEVTYDKPWLQNVLPYCQAELNDPTIGDAFKSVIYAAYASVNPQQAYNYSQQLSDWGSGNSATNQLYFVATRPSSSNICNTNLQTPQGSYYIQDVASGKYVTVSGSGSLAATASASLTAAPFTLAFMPGGGSILAQSNSQYVTADPNGQTALAAARATPSTYETFRWVAQSDGSYQLLALVNRDYVSTTSSNLVNNANSTNGITAGKYKLVPVTTGTGTAVPTSGTLKNVKTGKYVVATAANVTLLATATSAASATKWTFEKLSTSTSTTTYYDLRSQTTNQIVTGTTSGADPLTAARDVASTWESFQIISSNGNFVLIDLANGLNVAVQADNTLIANSNSVDSSSTWTIA
ncbi:glycosyl hydrolase family 81-domain-containing protein, partial [Umbelopsis sp. AD052]